MYNALTNYLIVSRPPSPDNGMQNNEKTDTTPAIPDIIAGNTRHCYNDRIKLAKTLAKNMNIFQKHLNNIFTRIHTRLPQTPLHTISCTRTFIWYHFFESEVLIPIF